MWWTADPPRPFQLCPVPISSALRFLVSGLPPVFIYRRFHVYLKESRIPIESPLMVRPLLLAEPGPGDASCTTWTLTVSFHHLHFQAGRPSSSVAFQWSSTLRSSPFVSNLPIFFVRLRSRDLPRSLPINQLSPFVSGLSAFFSRFRSVDLLRPFPVFRPSPFSCDSNLSIGWLLSTGGLNYSQSEKLSKHKKHYLDCFSNHKYQ